MRYTRLGSTGLVVPRIAVGCMTYGEPDRGNHPWTLTEENSRPLIEHALELGLTFFDTANVYSAGSSEEILGRALRDMAVRDDVVVASKVMQKMSDGPTGFGLSRAAIMSQIDQSLTRLGLDHVELYQIHRWDSNTPIEETMEALHDVVKAGKARYLGASSMFAWQFAKAQHAAVANGWTPFVTMQDQYNLIQREEEREMYPLCTDLGVGALPWSPLARGKLTRDWDAETDRSATDYFGQKLYSVAEDSDRKISAAVARIAADRGVPRAQIALAWVLANPVVTAPIVGAGRKEHLDDAVAALDIELSDDELAALDEHYVPHPIVGF